MKTLAKEQADQACFLFCPEVCGTIACYKTDNAGRCAAIEYAFCTVYLNHVPTDAVYSHDHSAGSGAQLSEAGTAGCAEKDKECAHDLRLDE